jgi:hypothetical protein
MSDFINTSDPAQLDSAVAPEPMPEPAPAPEPAQPVVTEPEAEADAEPPPRKRGGGPRSREGRDASRWNSTADSLSARVLLPPELAALADERTAEFKLRLNPSGQIELWLVSEMGFHSAQMTRANQMVLADLERIVESAHTTWDSDRREYVENLINNLSKDCERIRSALQKSKQGAELLVERFEDLLGILKTTGTWTEVQRHMALDLMGVPAALRQGYYRLPPDADAQVMAALAQSEIDRLRSKIDTVLTPKDNRERRDARQGIPHEEDAVSRRHRRGYADAKRNLRQAYAMLKEMRASASPRTGTDTAANTGTAQAPSPPQKAKEPIPPRPYAPPGAYINILKAIDEEDEPFAFLDPADREPKPAPPPQTRTEAPADTTPAPAANGAAAKPEAPAVMTPTPAPNGAVARPQAAATPPKAPQAAPRVKTPQQEQKERDDEARKAKRQREKQARKFGRKHK